MEKKMTKVEALGLALEIVSMLETDEQPKGLMEKLELMKAQETKIAEKKRSSDKPSKTAKEKAENAQKVVAFFENEAESEKAYTLQEIAIAIGLDGATPQKISPIVKLASDSVALEVVKTKEKKNGYKLA